LQKINQNKSTAVVVAVVQVLAVLQPAHGLVEVVVPVFGALVLVALVYEVAEAVVLVSLRSEAPVASRAGEPAQRVVREAKRACDQLPLPYLDLVVL
jgi:hypothetical protein